MEYRLLGPLEVRRGGVPCSLGGTKQRALLALLLLDANRVVALDRLVDDLWENTPKTAIATIQVFVSRLRKLLPEGALQTHPPGYLLRVEPGSVDLRRFERLLDDARDADPARASELLREALALWWPDGVCCARCLSGRVGFLETRGKHHCRDCGYQFRVTAGTVLHDSHAPPATWLVAVKLMLESQDGFPASQLHARIGGSYKTSWFLEHRIRRAMAQALRRVRPADPVALATDETAAGGQAIDETSPADAAPEAVARGVRLIKQSAGAAYQRPSLEHLSAYWAETQCRATQTATEDAFRRTVLALLEATPVTYRELTQHSRHALRSGRGPAHAHARNEGRQDRPDVEAKA
jgi:hypothetical protein